jgi:hypothetical protein
MHRLRHHPDLDENPTPPAAPRAGAAKVAKATAAAEVAKATAEAAPATEAAPPGGRHLRVVEPIIDGTEEARQRSRAAHPAGTGRRRARPKRAAG